MKKAMANVKPTWHGKQRGKKDKRLEKVLAGAKVQPK